MCNRKAYLSATNRTNTGCQIRADVVDNTSQVNLTYILVGY